jgi:uncharacterized protein YggE
MKKLLSIFVIATAVGQCFAQLGGGSAAFGQRQNGSDAAKAAEKAKRDISKDEMPPSASSMFLDASILMNVKADEYVAMFGISQEGATLDEARQKMDAAISAFSEDLKGLGVKPDDMFVDFVAQNRIYGYEITGELAKERVVGFDVKKNVSIHYRDKTLLDRFMAAASKAGIFDLIKVDYLVKDLAAVQTRLMEEATRVIKRKAANHERLLGIKMRPIAQVYAERYGSYFPTEMYSNYTAQESENVMAGYRQNMTIQRARKEQTFYFDALDAKSFDYVVNPAVVEPGVQFTLYLKVKYETGVAAKAVKVAARTGSRVKG